MPNSEQTAPVRTHTNKIIGTKVRVFSAWEPSSYCGPHSTLMTLGGQVHGRIGSRRLPAELDRLPAMTEERSTAVRAWLNAQYEEAYQHIIAEYPEAAQGERDVGEITVIEE